MDLIVDRDEVMSNEAGTLADQIVQLGRDHMARVLGGWLDELRTDPELSGDEYGQHYIDGVHDALLTLIHAGAADPREVGQS